MKFKIVILNFILFAIIGCKQGEDKKENISDSKTEIDRLERISDNIINWADAINKNNTFTLEKMYASEAVKVISADSIINSASQIANYFEISKNKITSIESLFSVEANKDRGIYYELVKYKTEGLKEYIQLVIWRLENEKIIREFEFTKESTLESAKVDTTTISEKRKLWIELCNTNNPESLVKQLYTNNAIYFNHKPIIIGTEGLIKEYGYMNNKDYNLNLKPLKLEVVNADFAFEIGQCKGSYDGLYILVWKKQFDGNWKIDLDSNI